MPDRGFVAESLGDRERCFETIERRVQIELDAVRDADPPQQRCRDRRLFRRA